MDKGFKILLGVVGVALLIKLTGKSKPKVKPPIVLPTPIPSQKVKMVVSKIKIKPVANVVTAVK